MDVPDLDAEIVLTYRAAEHLLAVLMGPSPQGRPRLRRVMQVPRSTTVSRTVDEIIGVLRPLPQADVDRGPDLVEAPPRPDQPRVRGTPR